MLVAFFIGSVSYAQLAPTSQFSLYYLKKTLKIVTQDTINYQIDTTYLQNVYANDSRNLGEELSYLSTIRNTNLFSLIEASSSYAATTYLRDSLNHYSYFIVKALRYYLSDKNNYKYTQGNYGSNIISLAALVELPLELKDSLLNHKHLQLKVRARLGDKIAEDSIIRDFERTYHDTIYQTTPKENYTEQLLFIGSKKSLDALFGMLNRNIYLYIRKDEPWMRIDSLPRWSIISSNAYILEEISYYYRYDPCRFFDRYTYKPFYDLPQFDKLSGMRTNRFTIKKTYLKLGTQIYAELWKDYLEQKFQREINIDFNNLYVWLECQITPPPYMLKDSSFSTLLVNYFFPKQYDQPSIEQEKMEFQKRYLRTIQLLDNFYKDIWFRDDCQR